MFFYSPCAVSIEQQFEVADLLEQLLAHIRIADEHTLAGEVGKLYAVVDIRSGTYSLLAALELLVLHQLYAERVVDECVAGDACLLLVWFAESSVDDESFAFGTGRCFAFDSTNGDMSVDDTAILGVEPELAKNLLAYVAAVGELVVRTFLLVPDGFVVDEVPLEGGHLILII